MIFTRKGTHIDRNEKCLERNEMHLARNETRGGNLHVLLSSTVHRELCTVTDYSFSPYIDT